MSEIQELYTSHSLRVSLKGHIISESLPNCGLKNIFKRVLYILLKIALNRVPKLHHQALHSPIRVEIERNLQKGGRPSII